MNDRIAISYKLFAIGLVAVILLVILGAFAGGILLAPYWSGQAQAAPAPLAGNGLQAAAQVAPSDADIVAAYERALSDLYETTVPSVVSIRVAQRVEAQPELPNPFDSPESPLPQNPPEFFNRGQGSGFIWDQAGHIVTNNHVVEGATGVEVVFHNGDIVEAKVLGRDPDSDLAVIQVDVPASGLQPVTLGDSDHLKVGQLAIAIGSPLGQEFTMTSGIISAIDRTIRSGNTGFSIPEAIQTDAPINPGNSGGPLLNREGAVIGINTQILSRTGTNEGIGFAVPINTARLVVPTLIKGETYQYSWLGISGVTLIPELAGLMKLPAQTQGALISSVSADSPADQAGLVGSDRTLRVDGAQYQLGGDVITAIDGQSVKSVDELISYLTQQTRPGDTIKLDIIRSNGQQETLEVTLGVRPSAEDLLRQSD